MHEILRCYHSNETSSAVLSRGTMYLVSSSNFRVCAWNPTVSGHFNESLCSMRWEVVGTRKNGRARRRHARTPRVSPSRALVLSFAHYLRAPATQANSSAALSRGIIYSVCSSNSLSLWTNPVVWLHVLRKPLQHHLRFKILRTQGRTFFWETYESNFDCFWS